MWPGTCQHQPLGIDQSRKKRATWKAATTPPIAVTANWQCDECGRICKWHRAVRPQADSQEETLKKRKFFAFCVLSIYTN